MKKLAVGIALGALSLTLSACDAFCGFDQSEWADGRTIAPQDASARNDALGPLAEELIDCGDLEGFTRSEVAATLGRPDRNDFERFREWGYDIGIPGDLLSDYPDLVVEFGADGTVAKVSVPGRVEE